MVTFGFTLLVTDVAIMIMTYYSVIGGWITEYLAVYLAGQGVYAAEEGYFTSFITSEVYPIIFMLLFLAITAFIVYSGVEKGIERFAMNCDAGIADHDCWNCSIFIDTTL